MLRGFSNDEDDPVNAETEDGGALGNIHWGMERFAGAVCVGGKEEVGRDDYDINTERVVLDAVVDGEVDK